jgi:hypothetical protein
MRHLHVDPKTLDLTRIGWWGFPQEKSRDKPDLNRRGLPVSTKRYRYLSSGQGFLDDSFFARTQFHLDGRESCHLLCFNEKRSYGFQLSTGTGHFVFFTPGQKGYTIICFNRDRERKDRIVWKQKLPLRVRAMVLAGENLFLAGVPDVIDPNDPLASLEERTEASLIAVRAESGEELSELKLDAPPVFDGLIAAAGRLYFTDRAGHVRCFAAPQRILQACRKDIPQHLTENEN